MDWLLKPVFAIRHCGSEGWWFCAGFVVVFSIIGLLAGAFGTRSPDLSYTKSSQAVVAAYAVAEPRFYYKTSSGYKFSTDQPTYVGDQVAVWCKNNGCLNYQPLLVRLWPTLTVFGAVVAFGFVLWLGLYIMIWNASLELRISRWRNSKQRRTAPAT